MALIEVDENELAKLQAKAAERDTTVASKLLLDKLGSDPKTRRETLQLIKKVAPNTPIPELDALEPIEGELKKRDDAIAALTKRLDDEKAASEKDAREQTITSKIEKGRDFLRTSGCGSDAVAAVEEHMKKHGISNYEAALAHYEKTHPETSSPVIPSQVGRAMPMTDDTSDEDLKKAVETPFARSRDQALSRFTGKMVAKTLQEIRSGRAA